MPTAERRARAAARQASTGGASKKGAAKGGARKPAGDDGDGFTSGAENANIRKETVGASKRPRAQDLPGMEDRRIPELHEAALQYASIRDRRMELNKEEGELKDKLIQLMKKHKKETYDFEGVKIVFEHVEEDTLKVKVRKPDDGDGDEDSGG